MNAVFDIAGIVLETPRLLLREWRESDMDDLFAYASVPGVGEAAGWSHHKDKEESLERIRHFIAEKHVFALVEKNRGKVIGSLGVEEYELEDKLTEFQNYRGREIGYVLSKEWWGQGLMTEAVQRVIAYLFDELDYDFLLCGHFDGNDRSRRVQEKCGFVPYRKLTFDMAKGGQKPGVLSLLTNPRKKIIFRFSHPETLIIHE